MRALPIAVSALTALVATLTLTACDDGGSGDKGGEKADNSASPARSSAGSTACKADQVGQEVAASEAPAAGDTGSVSVTLTNRSGADCTLEGFPRVDLTAGGTSWTLDPEEDAQPEKLTLKADETTAFTITYVRGPAGDANKGAAVTTVKFGLPGAGVDLSFPWKYGEVALRSASEPDASVGPLQRAGD
ncbi:DUF4232 domain-containing protein [Streptomyces sp. NBC_00878]|uniref:DUF4232 domain-containing protein n=1 Tax=Streptomyces sp. NBC_00878 TaxID=2975854 RepID=UPI00224DF8AA|nr:DUF4232 domain-containing protein [Streptomyces sp. NBC_00878]MCX4907740.1 DUF4232 domain-containing protein [Streptomyces sp. NBC_00878]